MLEGCRRGVAALMALKRVPSRGTGKGVMTNGIDTFSRL